MILSYLVATSGFAKGIAIGAALVLAAKTCRDRRKGDRS
jgi:hypothetical protein